MKVLKIGPNPKCIDGHQIFDSIYWHRGYVKKIEYVEKIGGGCFGTVYKATIPEHTDKYGNLITRFDIAIKHVYNGFAIYEFIFLR